VERRTWIFVWSIIWSLAVTGSSGLLGSAGAALQKPAYSAGDHWVYVSGASMSAFPGLNSSQGTGQFGLVGQVEVRVIGPASVPRGNTSVPTIQVNTRATGFLNGTFQAPGFGSADITGTFTTESTEFWEDQAYLPIESTGTTSYVAHITYVIPTDLVLDFRANASTTVSPVPTFDLDVGQSATATLATHLELNSTFTFFGQTRSQTNATDGTSTWRREVLSRENVTVEAGTFPSYRLNQTASGFSGLPLGIAAANETAYFSNDVGYYTKREAYANGSRVGEVRLKSYSFGPAGPSWLGTWGLPLLLVAVVAGTLLVTVLWRRRKDRIRQPGSPAPPDIPPSGGGGDRAR
jgi:hypothetical protein